MTTQTLRSGFVPYTGREHDPGRRTSGARASDPLAVRTVGRTVLHVYARETAGHGLNGSSIGQTAYAVVAIGNVGREGRTLATLPTLDQAERYLGAYSPRYGLLG